MGSVVKALRPLPERGRLGHHGGPTQAIIEGIPMDIVFIRGLHIETIVGVHDWERHTPRSVVLDLELASDVARGAATDRIAEALDYDAVTRRLRSFVSESRFQLIETLAEGCAAILLTEFAVPWVRLVLHKPGAVGEGVDVGVLIERGSRPEGRPGA
jgi:7,8-dihydroneopterin aldolase/epimerase/oxygenase